MIIYIRHLSLFHLYYLQIQSQHKNTDRRQKLSENQVIILCPICGNQFQFGPHIYNGYHIPRYQITVCLSCWKTNSDGWAPHLEDRLILHLEENYLPIPERNERGLLPRD